MALGLRDEWNKSRGVFKANPGSLLTALQRLERSGWLDTESKTAVGVPSTIGLLAQGGNNSRWRPVSGVAALLRLPGFSKQKDRYGVFATSNPGILVALQWPED
jgi:Transcriptional regulator PadR-like family